jgi:hypothetical protein
MDPQYSIPELFNAARQEMSLTSTDFHLSYDLPLSISSKPSLSLNYNFSNFQTGSGKLSFSGTDRIRGQNDLELGMNKIFYSRKFGNLTLETGIGYDYEREKTLSYQYDTSEITNFNKIQYNNIDIKNIVNTSFFGNFNSIFSVSNTASLITGLEFLYTTIIGASYEESYSIKYHEEGASFSGYSSQSLYNKKDYFFQYAAGTGVLRNESFMFKKDDASSIILQWTGYHSYLSPKMMTQTYFFRDDEETPTVYSSSKYTNTFDLQFLRFNKASDSFNNLFSPEDKLQWLVFSSDYVKSTISYSNSHSRYLCIEADPEDSERSMFSKTFYQSNDFHLLLANRSKMVFFRYFYLNVSSNLEYDLSTIDCGSQYFSGWFGPGIGAKFSLFHTYLIDLKYSIGSSGFYTDFGFLDAYYEFYPAIQLRIAVLR